MTDRIRAVLAFAVTSVATISMTVALPAPVHASVPQRWYDAAPYVMPLDGNPPDLPMVMRATGQRTFTLSFVLAGSNSCAPAWYGETSPVSEKVVADMVSAVREAGGDVVASFGGGIGVKLGEVCPSAAATAAAYQRVIDRYALRAVDFDLEAPEDKNTVAIAHELGAAKIVQAGNPGLHVSVTMSGDSPAAGPIDLDMLNQARRLGFTPDSFSLMPFGGGWFRGGGSQIWALEALHLALMAVYGWDSPTAYAHEGFSGMNGRSNRGEYFYPSDFRTVLDYVTRNGLRRFTFWSLNRDRPCPAPTDRTSGVCSSIPQRPWEFTEFTTAFGTGT